MISLKQIIFRFGALAIVMSILILISNVQFVKKSHAIYCSHISQNTFNLINPVLKVDYIPKAPDNAYGIDFTVKIYDKRKINQVINKRTIKNIKPTKIIYQTHRVLFLVPVLFLLALFIVTPLNVKTKLTRLPVALILFNVFMVFYQSYGFEFLLTDNNFEINSFWLFLCWLGGLGGSLENVFLVAAIIWGIVLGWPLYMKYSKLNNK